jgi:hypothetical protein
VLGHIISARGMMLLLTVGGTPLFSPEDAAAFQRGSEAMKAGDQGMDLERLRAAFESECEKDGQRPVVKESGTRHIDDLANRDTIFEGVFTHARVLASVYHVLRDAFRVLDRGRNVRGLAACYRLRFPGRRFRWHGPRL